MKVSIPCFTNYWNANQLLDKKAGGRADLEDTLKVVTVTNINAIPKTCKPIRLSFKTTNANSDAVTGSTIATIEATAGAVLFRPMI